MIIQNGARPITSEDAQVRLKALQVAYLQKTEKYDNLINKQKERQQVPSSEDSVIKTLYNYLSSYRLLFILSRLFRTIKIL